MKKLNFLVIVVLLTGSFCAFADEPIVKQVSIASTNVNVRTASAVVLATLPFEAPTAGRVVLRMDGYCVSDSADRIILAASNVPDWGTNDGSVSLYAPHSDFKRRAFSHTRVYDIVQGLDTFYAVAQNYVDENGSGIASVYGHLTLEFFPAAGPAMVIDGNINFSGDVRSTQKVLQRVYAPSTPAGKAVVHLDGKVVSDAGDRIVLSAANVPSWLVGDGSVAVKAYNSYQKNSPFSHSRLYTANSSLDTLYAVCRNVVDASGSGTAAVYGNLSVEYFPNGGLAQVEAKGIELNDVDAEGAPVAFDSITITTSVPGFALAQLDGYCTSQLGDEMLFAVNNIPDWGANEGHVTVSAAYNTNKFSTISHSRLFTIAPGTHTYYSVVENFGNTAGDGLVDMAVNFSVKFFADPTVGVEDLQNNVSFKVYPNPVNDQLLIMLNPGVVNLPIYLTDLSGRIMQQMNSEEAQTIKMDVSGLAKGVYFISCGAKTQKIIKQ
ncbi:MAG: T9SS type A sorting domain-containing protein [Chitinophagales bacterium]|nr:T9SS type A sorting domain-containing protein [Chitinophagales bacterium]